MPELSDEVMNMLIKFAFDKMLDHKERDCSSHQPRQTVPWYLKDVWMKAVTVTNPGMPGPGSQDPLISRVQAGRGSFYKGGWAAA